MKFFSLFTKAPQHQRFAYKPRFYDAQKEELEERESRIKRELERERGVLLETPGNYRTRIAGSFQAARKRSKPAAEPNAAMIRLTILLFLTLFIIAFLQWGQPALYLLILFVPFYFFLKFRRR
ncbi:MAG: hypothetical protein KF775_13190 [Cyclobacteriaceae bacterium]|nr:hypothetical protein [Cytophagales bacterium]MBX2900604.1 hypothetical protein [Cyclobacteriaceae bacterium]